ncbi:hypothetical protein INT45_006766 [Circinella minor]|uniref:Sialate O-acetylesterase domain-containing protein n=1 Tax=Circinella minor TaxID=1195481 RepID=A0A8H7S839_9FUNG|nr:hypothetical protein INT45_006766 [Circinella minor]
MVEQHIYTQVNSYQVLQRDFSTDSALVKQANGIIQSFPVGGPYQINNASNVLVGDIWVLAGQSNMRGNAFYVDPWTDPPNKKTYPDYVNDMIHLFQLNETWNKGTEPTHRLDQSIRQVNYDISDPSVSAKSYHNYRGVSSGMAFATAYRERNGDVPVGLLPSAHGGTTMDQWSPDLLETTKNPYNTTLYGAMLGRIDKATAGSRKIAGILWYQGESDAADTSLASQYKGNLGSWINTTRSKLNNERLPFVYVQIARLARVQNDQYEGWNQVRNAQRLLNDNDNSDKERIGAVASIDLEMDDYIHLSAKGLTTVGQRMAITATNALKNKASMSSPTFDSVKFEEKLAARNGNNEIDTSSKYATQVTLLVKFKNVNEWKFRDDGVFGFTLHDSSGNLLQVLYKSEIQQDKKTIRLFLTYDAQNLDTNNLFLYYGYGMNPVCNMETTEGMGLLAFGPIPVQLNY